MSEMISVASGFQYSVNIAYDLNSEEKLRNYIPTKAAMQLMEDILQSTQPAATDRARVLIGAYGKGKSHIVLAILSLLMKKDLSLFEKLIPAAKKNPTLYQQIENYYASDNKLLPVLITGSNTSLTQAFLLALQRTLTENNLLDIMPATNYQAAANVIERWKTEYQDTFQQFRTRIQEPISKFIEKLNTYDIRAYETFERIYPELTAGSIFNPFLGFDVVQLYEEVVHALQARGYTGVYVVYDEFSKYLEANITEASVSDTKMLQDFAEKCNRSGMAQIHLMLISHKEIANYIDKLPKQKVDGWRGVSERFTHIHLNNNFTQTYEIIESVILKKESIWKPFVKKYYRSFEALTKRYITHPIFADVTENAIEHVIKGCYPLHPVSTFILPRLSERVAQNERTLFTFLSANGVATLPAFLDRYQDDSFSVITPDLIYDYFEPLFRKEIYTGTLHDTYVLTAIILEKLDIASLEAKLVKTLSLIYMLEQFEKLKPTKDELIGIYSMGYEVSEIERAITNLIDEEYVIYLKRSNGYLRLKESSGVDIQAKIKDVMATMYGNASIKKTLNTINFDDAVYPYRYNDEKEMTRYFAFNFIEAEEVTADVEWTIKSENIQADGVVYAVIPNSRESIPTLQKTLLNTSQTCKNCVFILPYHFTPMDYVVREYKAVEKLKEMAQGDAVLFDEYEVIYEDLQEILREYIAVYTRPEKHQAMYIYCGEIRTINRKTVLTELLSDICFELYPKTPVIVNEAINKNTITSVAQASRNKIVAGLLRSELEPNLGLSGTGQEVSIMRSTLIRTGILLNESENPHLNCHPKDKLVEGMLQVIEQFVQDASGNYPLSFADLYQRLTSAENQIGLRRGVIPIYMAAIFHGHRQELLIQNRYGQVLLNNDTILQIEADPAEFTLQTLHWNNARQTYLDGIAAAFQDYVVEEDRYSSNYGYVAAAIRRWYVALPKYAKEATRTPDGKKIDRSYRNFIKEIKQNGGSYSMLFERFPAVFGYDTVENTAVLDSILAAKRCYDFLLSDLHHVFADKLKALFNTGYDEETLAKISLSSTIRDWCDSLNSKAFEQLFPDGTEKMLSLLKNTGSNEIDLISRIGKLATDLRIEDWNSDTQEAALTQITEWKKTAEQFHEQQEQANIEQASNYQLIYSDDNGNIVTKRFNRVETTPRGYLLRNMIEDALSGMGQAISEQEKRQILMDALKELC